MVNDVFGIWQAYGPSKRNVQNWHFTDLDIDSRVLKSNTFSVTNDGFTGKGSYAIMTTSRYKQTLVTLNHNKCQAQGFMMATNDWRDVEITGQFRYNSTGEGSRITIYVRSGDRTRPCEGTGYGVTLTPDGRVTCDVRQWFPGGITILDSVQGAAGDIEGKWVGFKVCIFNNENDSHVNIKAFIDENINNQYQDICTATDTGTGTFGNKCSDNPNQVITWGGPLAVLLIDGEDTNVDVRYLSVREIDPYNRYGAGGGLTGEGFELVNDVTTLESFTPYSNLPTIIDVGDEVPDEEFNQMSMRGVTTMRTPTGMNKVLNKLVSGTYAAGDPNKTLYQLTGKTVNFVEGPYKTRHYASGKPDDTTKEWNTANGVNFANMEITMYVTIANPDHDDTISVKCYGPNHDDGIGAWYICDLGFMTGEFTMGWEEPHPHTTLDITGSKFGSIVGKKIGYKVVIWQVGTGAHMEGWIDTGDNLWRQGIAVLNPDGKLYSPDPNQKVQIRIDACPNITMWGAPTCKEITAGGVFVGSPTGPGPSPPPPGNNPPVDTRPIIAAPISNAMVDLGGSKWSASKIHLIFAGADWNTRTSPHSRDQSINSVKALLASNYFDHLIQYGIKRPTLGNIVTNTTFSLSDGFVIGDAVELVKDSITRGQVPTPENNIHHSYFVFPRSGIAGTNGEVMPEGFILGGFHGWGLPLIDTIPINWNLAFVVSIGNYASTFTEQTRLMSHEITEMITDPFPVIYEDGSTNMGIYGDSGYPWLHPEDGLEISDVCQRFDGTVSGYAIEPYWSNQSGGCIIPASAPTFMSCHEHATWNPITQQCEADPGYIVGGDSGIPDWGDIGDDGTGGDPSHGPGSGGDDDPWEKTYTGGAGHVMVTITGDVINGKVKGSVTGTINGVGGASSLATFAGIFSGTTPNDVQGIITGNLAGTGTGTGNSTTGNKTGDFTANVDGTIVGVGSGFGTGTASGKVTGMFTGIGTGDGGDDGDDGTGTGEDGQGNTGGDDGTPSPTPDPATSSPVFVESGLQVTWAIDSMDGDPCNINSPSEETGLVEIFNAAPDDLYVQTLQYRKVGIYVNKITSVFVGKKIRNVKAVIRRTGDDPIQGLVFCRIRSSNRSIVEEFPDMLDSSVITTTDVTYEFTHPSPGHIIERGDFIYIEYPSGGDVDNFLEIKICETDKADGEASCLVTYDGANEVINFDKDAGFIVSI